MSKFFKSNPDGKGGFTSIEWSLGEYISANIIGIVFTLVLIVIFCSTLLPILFLFFYYIGNSETRKRDNIVGILAGIYYLVDYNNGWITYSFLNCFGHKFVNVFTYFNSAIMLTHVMLLFFGKKIWSIITEKGHDENTTNFVFILYVIAIIVVGYMLSHAIIPHLLEPIQKPI